MPKRKRYNITGTTDKPEFSNYKKGAIIGGLLGGIAGVLAGKRILLYIVIGAVAGGYIAYQTYKDDYTTISLKKFINTNENDG